ncbi:MAG: hypothetical protein PVG32_21055 [Anaerolineales bacterium]|jgi:hypothetical protein
MTPIISIHEYKLKPGVKGEDFEAAVQKAMDRNLLRLPGLVDSYLLKGIRGKRQGQYAAVWVYENKETWQALWGPLGQPIRKADYPENWKLWEDEVLAPFLDQDPDKISFTSYQTL